MEATDEAGDFHFSLTKNIIGHRFSFSIFLCSEKSEN